MKQLLIALLAVTLMVGAVAACASSTGDTSGSAVEPGSATAVAPGLAPTPVPPAQPGVNPVPVQPVAGEPANLAEVLAKHGATERIAFEILNPECGKSVDCMNELQQVVVFCAAGSATVANCPAAMAKFSETLTAGQRTGQIPLQTTFPQVKDVITVLDLVKQEQAGGGVAPAPAVGAAMVVKGVADSLQTATEKVDWPAVKDAIGKAAPDQSVLIIKQVEDALNGMPDDPTAVIFVSGQPVDPAAAAALLTKISESLK